MESNLQLSEDDQQEKNYGEETEKQKNNKRKIENDSGESDEKNSKSDEDENDEYHEYKKKIKYYESNKQKYKSDIKVYIKFVRHHWKLLDEKLAWIFRKIFPDEQMLTYREIIYPLEEVLISTILRRLKGESLMLIVKLYDGQLDMFNDKKKLDEDIKNVVYGVNDITFQIDICFCLKRKKQKCKCDGGYRVIKSKYHELESNLQKLALIFFTEGPNGIAEKWKEMSSCGFDFAE
jgi:hypothetical protein